MSITFLKQLKYIIGYSDIFDYFFSMRTIYPFILTIIFAVFNYGCSTLSSITVGMTEEILSHGVDAMFEEGDLDIAEKSLPANLKLLEGFHRADPNNQKISLLLIEGYTGYALGFVEDVDAERAKILYSKGRDFGLSVLKKNNQFKNNFDGNLSEFKNSLIDFTKEDVPLIFWTANAWGNLINLSLNDPEVIKDLYKVNTMMQFVIQQDESYFYGGAHIYFGTILATQPRVLGGNPDLAKTHFDKAIAIGKGKFLLPNIYYAKSYAVQTQNSGLFISLLNKTLEASIDILPQHRLVNAISKRKAKLLLEKQTEYFE